MGLLHDVASNRLLQASDGKCLLDTLPVVGSKEDFAARMRRLLPMGWFSAPPQDGEQEQAPVLQALLLGMGSVLSGVAGLIQQAGSQMRLGTMSGPFLDMAAEDYFGSGGLERLSSETDLQYRNRIRKSLMMPLNTRAVVSAAVKRVTGYAPTIIEPMNAADCHAFGSVGGPSIGGGYGYGVSGLRYGSAAGGQFFIETVGGNSPAPAAIFSAVAKTAALGVNGWVRIDG